MDQATWPPEMMEAALEAILDEVTLLLRDDDRLPDDLAKGLELIHDIARNMDDIRSAERRREVARSLREDEREADA